MIPALASIVLGYLLGSVDFGVVVSRAKGVDIYQVGSGNPGTANVMRVLGKRYAALVLLGDLAKGLAAALVGLWLGGRPVGYAAGLAAVVGHCFPVWHRFRGGKGVATAAGMLLGLQPLVAIALGLTYAVVVLVTGISSLGSLIATALSIPAVALAGDRGWSLLWLGLAVLLVVARHRENIRRLIAGQERKVRTGEG